MLEALVTHSYNTHCMPRLANRKQASSSFPLSRLIQERRLQEEEEGEEEEEEDEEEEEGGGYGG